MKDIEFLKSNGVDIDKSLEIFGDINTYNDTIGEFLTGIDSKIKKLAKYKNNNDMQNYAIFVHSLKSDAKYFGFTALADVAYAQELKAKSNDAYYITEHFNELETLVSKSKNLVKEYLSDDNKTSTTKEDVNINAPIYKKETILVVDDSNIVRNFVSRIFSDKYSIGIAENGEEAINILKANSENDKIVTILLDLNMPKVSGFKVLDYMKEKDLLKKSPVSIITGDSSKETIDRAFTYGIVDMLTKPFNAEDVKRVVEKNLYYRDMNKNK